MHMYAHNEILLLVRKDKIMKILWIELEGIMLIVVSQNGETELFLSDVEYNERPKAKEAKNWSTELNLIWQ